MNVIENLKNWLFTSAQITGGCQSGAVVGGFNIWGDANYVYGEISGYFLTFLAFVARNDGDRRCWPAASKLLEWLRGQWESSPAQTRVLIAQTEPDWRNTRVFSFDLAMILRGLTLACGAELLETDRCAPIMRAIARELHLLVADDGTLASCRRRQGYEEEVPSRWSTNSGPYQLKTAAGILSSSPLGRSSELEAAAKRTVVRWRRAPLEASALGDLHPFFYHLEGLLTLVKLHDDRDALEIVSERFGNLIADEAAMSRFLSADAREGERTRSDVLSQAIRVGSILALERVLPRRQLESALEAFESRLFDFIDPDGAVRFNQSAPAAAFNTNTWCAMFAYQALWLRRHGIVLPSGSGLEYMLI